MVKKQKGFWRLGRTMSAEPASGRFAAAFVIVAAATVGAMQLIGVPEAALGWTGAGLSLLAVVFMCAAHFTSRGDGRSVNASGSRGAGRVLACKAMPKDNQLAPVWIGQGLAESSRAGQRQDCPQPQTKEQAEAAPESTDEMSVGVVGRTAESVEELRGVDPVRVEIGYALVPLASASRSGEWLARIAALRREVAAELGMVVPPVRINDNIRLGAHEYTIKIHGIKVGSGNLFASQLLALAAGRVTGKLTGQESTLPSFGTPGVWIHPSQRRKAERMNYTVLDPAGILMAHLALSVRRHAADLLSREQVTKLLDSLSAEHPQLVAAVTAKLKVAQIQKVLQNLLREGISIADLKAVIEAIGDAAEKTDHVDELTEATRDSLGPTIARQYAEEDGRLWCVCIEPDLEGTIAKYLARTAAGSVIAVPRAVHQQITDAVSTAVASLRKRGRKPVVLCAKHVRAAVRQLIAPIEPDAAVLGHNEVKASTVQAVGTIGIEVTKPRTYRAATVAAAVAEVKRDLGRDAMILQTRRSRRGILLRLFGRPNEWEITAVANMIPLGNAPKAQHPRPVVKPAECRKTDAAQAAPKDDQPKGQYVPAAQTPAPPAEHVVRQMTEIHRMVETLVARDNGPAAKLPSELREFHELLLGQEVAKDIASQIIEQARKSLKDEQLSDRDVVARTLQDQIARRIATVNCGSTQQKTRRRVIALIGPTGVGKTTTIAKLAANFKLLEGRSVGLVTLDTYRIAAVDQLRMYAKIIEVPLRVVLTPRDLRKAIDFMAGTDVVLIDTAGRSQNDKLRLNQLHSFLADADVDETHLVVSATSNRACIKRTIGNFAPLGANRVILTKLDEAETFGSILNIAWTFNAPFSYVTTGQDVPDDISAADANQLAGRIMGGLLCAT